MIIKLLEIKEMTDCLATSVGAGECKIDTFYLRISVWQCEGGEFIIYCIKSLFSLFNSSLIGKRHHLFLDDRERIAIREATLPLIIATCQTAYPNFKWRWIHEI